MASTPILKLRVIQSKVTAGRESPALAAQAEAVYHLAEAVGVELVVNSPNSQHPNKSGVSFTI